MRIVIEFTPDPEHFGPDEEWSEASDADIIEAMKDSLIVCPSDAVWTIERETAPDADEGGMT